MAATASAPYRYTTFFAVGPNTDVYSLHRLHQNERRILYVDPLNTQRNGVRIKDFRARHHMNKLTGGEVKTFEGLFECEGTFKSDECLQNTPALNSSHVQVVVRQVLEGLQSMSNLANWCRFQHSGLAGLRVLRHRLLTPARGSREPPRLVVDFWSDGVQRSLHYIFARFEDVELGRELTDEASGQLYPVSTYTFIGVGPVSVPPFDALCEPNSSVSMPTFRIVALKNNLILPRDCRHVAGTSVANPLNSSCVIHHSRTSADGPKPAFRYDQGEFVNAIGAMVDSDGDGDAGPAQGDADEDGGAELGSTFGKFNVVHAVEAMVERGRTPVAVR